MKLTKPQRRALEILRDESPNVLCASMFGMLMWPDSRARLTGLNRPAGKLLNKLRDMGLADRFIPADGIMPEYRITAEGRVALRRVKEGSK